MAIVVIKNNIATVYDRASEVEVLDLTDSEFVVEPISEVELPNEVIIGD